MPTRNSNDTQDLILKIVLETQEEQKELMDTVNDTIKAQILLQTDVEAGRNGYSAHEIVKMLHWVDKEMKAQEENQVNIKKAIISQLFLLRFLQD